MPHRASHRWPQLSGGAGWLGPGQHLSTLCRLDVPPTRRAVLRFERYLEAVGMTWVQLGPRGSVTS